MHSSFAIRTISVLALLAMTALQLAGGIIRYCCDCTGVAVITSEEHCHGSKGELGPLHHAPTGHHHHHSHGDHEEVPADPSGDDHHHELVMEPTHAVTPILASAPAPGIPTDLWFEIPHSDLVPAWIPHKAAKPIPDVGLPPPLPLIVVGSVLFLI